MDQLRAIPRFDTTELDLFLDVKKVQVMVSLIASFLVLMNCVRVFLGMKLHLYDLHVTDWSVIMTCTMN